jgi:biopolymer transport protein TolQ
MNPVEVASSPLAAPVAEITIWSMFWGAHIVVKCVIVGLLCASIWSVMVIIDKSLLVRRTRRTMDLFDEAFWSGNSLEELYNKISERPTSGTASLFVAAMREWKRSLQNPHASFMGLHSRIDKVLDVSIGREIEKLESSLLVLATVASASPFVGLFGTVWGIMTAFRSIAASKNTSLAVVAPGIAEALFATAVGLVAAIPALIFYNKLQGDVSKAQARLETFADEFSAILSREIDQTAGGRDRAA